MRTITYKQLRDGTLRLAGLDPTSVAATDKLKVMEFLAVALKQAHEHWRWPDLVLTQQRYFRPVWVADDYDEDYEVYDVDTDAYYRATTGATEADIPGESAAWEELVDFDRVVEWAQEGEVAIEAVLAAWSKDPRAYSDAVPLEYRLDSDGIHFPPSEETTTTVWLEFRFRCPDFTYASEFVAGNFESGVQVYDPTTGDIWQATDDVTSADIPGTSADWARIDVPYIFEIACKRWAHALFAGSDGAVRKGLMTEEEFKELLDEQVWQFTKLQGQTGRVTRSSK